MSAKTPVLIMILVLCLALASAGCSESIGSASGDTAISDATFFRDYPVPPDNLTYTATSTALTLRWTMPAWEDRYDFEIYRWEAGDSPKLLDTVPAGVHEYLDRTPAQGHTYFYLVITREKGMGVSRSGPQIANAALTPPAYQRNATWRDGQPFAFGSDPDVNRAWASERAAEIRERLPWLFVEEDCPVCDGGIVRLDTTTNGLPDLAWCPACNGSGRVVNAYPKN